jgi:hypothetical protein
MSSPEILTLQQRVLFSVNGETPGSVPVLVVRSRARIVDAVFHASRYPVIPRSKNYSLVVSDDCSDPTTWTR